MPGTTVVGRYVIHRWITSHGFWPGPPDKTTSVDRQLQLHSHDFHDENPHPLPFGQGLLDYFGLDMSI